MNRDPFLRLALIAACTAFALGLVLIGLWLGPTLLAGIVICAIGLTCGMSLVLGPGPKKPEAETDDLRRRRRQPAEGTRGFERVE